MYPIILYIYIYIYMVYKNNERFDFFDFLSLSLSLSLHGVCCLCSNGGRKRNEKKLSVERVSVAAAVWAVSMKSDEDKV